MTISPLPAMHSDLCLGSPAHLAGARRHWRATRDIHRGPRLGNLEAIVFSAGVKRILKRLGVALVDAGSETEAAGVHLAKPDTAKYGVLELWWENIARAISIWNGVDGNRVLLAGAVGVLKDLELVRRSWGN